MFKLNRNQKSVLKDKNTSKRYSAVGKVAICVLVLLALSSCTPNKTETKSATTNNNNSVQTETQVETEIQVEPQIQAEPEVQVQPEEKFEPQEEEEYSKAEIERGAQRVNDTIALYESEFRSDGKTRKSPAELSNAKYVLSVLRGLDINSLGKYANGFEMMTYKTNNCGMITINKEIVDCEKDFINVTTEVKKGLKNVKAEIARLESNTTNGGKIKTKEEINLDKYTSAVIEDHMSKEPDKQISFLVKVSEKCEIKSSFNDKSILVIADSNDGKICLSCMQHDEVKGWVDNTEEYQNKMDYEQKKEAYKKYLENIESPELGQ